MNGFFSKKEVESKSRPDGKVYSCASCGLYKNSHTIKMKPSGRNEKNILIIGTASSLIDDKKGKHWRNRAGKLLKHYLHKNGIDLYRDCLSINAVNCHPPNGRLPSNYEIDCCRSVLVSKIIDKYQPKLILVLGAAALHSVIGHRWKKDMNTFDKWRGWTIPDKELKAWLCPIFHPSEIIDCEKHIKTIWLQDLKNAITKVNESLPRFKTPIIDIIEDLTPLQSVSGLVSIDYETTGLKPHAFGHRIICASVADTADHCYVFMLPPTKKRREPLIQLLANQHISKMAHNMKFEEAWSVVKLKQPVMNWEWDSMIAAHVLDNRPGITGLKFQTYVNFGIIDYSSEIEPYLQSIEKKNANAHNRIYDLLETEGGHEKLLNYCAYDTITQYRLALLQIKALDYSFLPF